MRAGVGEVADKGTTPGEVGAIEAGVAASSALSLLAA
jgi:hypothetical protein